MDPNLPQWVLEPEIANPNLEYTIQIEPPAWRPYSDIEIECEGNISAWLYSITNRDSCAFKRTIAPVPIIRVWK